jgi:anti-anti-sigma regulatory factor
MILTTINKSRKLLFINYIGIVTAAEFERGYEELKVLLAELPNGFRLLVDYCRLESMDMAGIDALGRTMELLEQHGVELVVRVIPDPSKDIGIKIISIFHYKNAPRMVVCQNMLQAAQALGW